MYAAGPTPRTRRFAVARRWRLRNKLLLGLGLMVGCVGALIAGTAYGLSSYMRTMKTTDSKLNELLLLDELKPVAVAILVEPTDATPRPPALEPPIPEITPADGPSPPTPPPGPRPPNPPIPEITPADGPTGDVRRAKQRLAQAKAVFAKYKSQFEETVRRGRDPDPYHDSQLIAATEQAFAALEAAIDQYAAVQDAPVSKRLAQDGTVDKEHRLLLKNIDDLRIEVASDMYNRIGRARHDYNRAIGIVAGATAVALLLVATLVSLFSGWVFKP